VTELVSRRPLWHHRFHLPVFLGNPPCFFIFLIALPCSPQRKKVRFSDFSLNCACIEPIRRPFFQPGNRTARIASQAVKRPLFRPLPLSRCAMCLKLLFLIATFRLIFRALELPLNSPNADSLSVFGRGSRVLILFLCCPLTVPSTLFFPRVES